MNERRDSSSFRRRTGARLDAYRAFTRHCAHGSRPSTSVDGVHFSLSNASRPVRRRPKRRPGVRRCRSRVTVVPDRWPAGGTRFYRTVLTLNTLRCESRTRLARVRPDASQPPSSTSCPCADADAALLFRRRRVVSDRARLCLR